MERPRRRLPIHELINQSILPTTTTSLVVACNNLQEIGVTLNTRRHFRLVPGYNTGNRHASIPHVNGDYGILYTYDAGRERPEFLASCGFSLEGSTMVINHTPQGLINTPKITEEMKSRIDQKYLDKYMSSRTPRRARTDLAGHDYRLEMMEMMITIAKGFTEPHLQNIQGISFENNTHLYNLALGKMPIDFDPINNIDKVFLDSGFTFSEQDKNYYLPL